MPSKNKRRGNDFEVELREAAKAAGFQAVRAWGSDGRSLGEAADVDLVVNGFKVQAKRRKKLPAYLEIPDSCDIVAFKQDRKKPMVLIYYDDFLKLIEED